ncbi:helix-turn-helix transcriptional regulator [Sanguibacter sp. A247]|uniref:helix-turn-helix transcriptional regulator n=1 Tax=unclassified Sanguibacter TaxID=2645534 RepID=UPI003FD74BFB
MAENAPDRLVRMLGLLAFLGRHDVTETGYASWRLDELAERFEVTPRRILADINLLFVAGLPGHGPEDLIDFDLDEEDGYVALREPHGMARPLRLSTREAVALVAALRTLAANLDPEVQPREAAEVASTLEVLTAAAGAAAHTASLVDVDLGAPAPLLVRSAVVRALEERRRLRLRYVSASDVVSVRDVDPVRLLTEDSHGYLVAFCQREQAGRSFRLDRILEAEVLAELADPHPELADVPTFRPAPGNGTVLATIVLRSPARWVAESVPVEEVRELEDGAFELDLVVRDLGWFARLVLEEAENVVSVAPAELHTAVVDAATAALAAYDG